MALFILIAVILAVVKGRRVTVLFREISFLPMWIVEIIFWYFQISAWLGDYRFLPYGKYLQVLNILVLCWPILKFKLYNQAFCGALCVAVGSILNNIVMQANDGKMPVYPTLSKVTRYYRSGAIESAGDAKHFLMAADTKLSFLADYIDVGFSIMSIGDLFIHSFTTMVVYYAILKLNESEEGLK